MRVRAGPAGYHIGGRSQQPTSSISSWPRRVARKAAGTFGIQKCPGDAPGTSRPPDGCSTSRQGFQPGIREIAHLTFLASRPATAGHHNLRRSPPPPRANAIRRRSGRNPLFSGDLPVIRRHASLFNPECSENAISEFKVPRSRCGNRFLGSPQPIQPLDVPINLLAHAGRLSGPQRPVSGLFVDRG